MMKFTVEREAFLTALIAARSAVESRSAIPILMNVLIRSKDASTLTLRATDLDVQITCDVAADIEREGGFTLNAATLLEIVKKQPKAAQIAIEAKADGSVTVKSGRSRFSLQSLPEDDFPELGAGEFPHSFEMTGENMCRMIDKTHFAISTEETRYYLNGIFLHQRMSGNASHLAAVATDGHRLALFKAELPDGADGFQGVIVPRKAVQLIRKLVDEAETTKVELSSTKIRISIIGASLTSKLVDGTFPDYERVIPQGNDRTATVNRVDLANAVGRVSTISSERGRAIKLSLLDGNIALSVNDSDVGSAAEDIEVAYDAPAIDIGFNARYLEELLGILDGDDVEIKLAEAGSPTIFQKPDDDSFLAVLMPMRV